MNLEPAPPSDGPAVPADPRSLSSLACDLLTDGTLDPDASGVVIAGRLIPDELWFLATAGYLGDVHSGRSVRVRIDHDGPMSVAAATGRPVSLPTVGDIVGRYPALAAMVPDARAAIAIPAIHDGVVRGSFGITYRRPTTFGADVVRELRRIADAIARDHLAPLIGDRRAVEFPAD